MRRRSLGKTGITVSAIGLGCMGMSEFYGPGNDRQSLETLATVLEQGIDFLDTADMLIENAAATAIDLGADETAALDELFDPAAVASERYTPAAMAHLERA